MHQRSGRGQGRRAKKLIFLATAFEQHPTELRADLQRHYGLDIERLGKDFSVWHLAACAACLPSGSLLMARMEPRLAYSTESTLLHTIINLLASERVPFPWEKPERGELPELEAVTVEEFEAWRSGNFKEVDSWQVQ